MRKWVVSIVIGLGATVSAAPPAARGHGLGGTVTVMDAPASGVKVTLLGLKRSTVSDAKGGFHFEGLSPGEYTLEARHATQLARTTAVADERDVKLWLRVGRTVTGRVTDEKGTPIEAVELSLSDEGDDLELRSDATGRFVFPPTLSQLPVLFARRRGFIEKQTPVGESGEVQVMLERSLLLTGRVFDAEGKPVPRFTVSTTGPAFLMDVEGRDGGFALDVTAGVYRLTIVAPPHATTQVEASAPSEVTVRLRHGAQLSGVVLEEEGAPPQVALVTLRGPSNERSETKRAGPDGRFVFGGLAAGEYQLSAMNLERGVMAWTVRTTLSLEEARSAHVKLQPERGALLMGRVLSADDVPVSGASVIATQLDAGYSPKVIETDDAGRFRIATIPAGPVKLRARLRKQDVSVETVAPDSNIVIRFVRDAP